MKPHGIITPATAETVPETTGDTRQPARLAGSKGDRVGMGEVGGEAMGGLLRK
jgi:hypothetical protein